MPGIDRPIGTNGHVAAVAYDGWHFDVLVLVITQRPTHFERVLCVALGPRAHASLMSAGCCWRRSLAVEGGFGDISGTCLRTA